MDSMSSERQEHRGSAPRCEIMDSVRLSLFHDRRLPAALRRATSLHVARCAGCRARLRSMESMGQALKAQPAEPRDPRLAERVRREAPRPKPWAIPLLSGGVLAAALLGAALAGFHVGIRRSPEAPAQADPSEGLTQAATPEVIAEVAPEVETKPVSKGVRLAPVLGPGMPLGQWGLPQPVEQEPSEPRGVAPSSHELAGGAASPRAAAEADDRAMGTIPGETVRSSIRVEARSSSSAGTGPE